jgi:hypothetical protein
LVVTWRILKEGYRPEAAAVLHLGVGADGVLSSTGFEAQERTGWTVIQRRCGF